MGLRMKCSRGGSLGSWHPIQVLRSISEPPPHSYFPSETCLMRIEVNCGKWWVNECSNARSNGETRQVLVYQTYCECCEW